MVHPPATSLSEYISRPVPLQSSAIPLLYISKPGSQNLSHSLYQLNAGSLGNSPGIQHERYRSIVQQVDHHMRAKDAGFDRQVRSGF